MATESSYLYTASPATPMPSRVAARAAPKARTAWGPPRRCFEAINPADGLPVTILAQRVNSDVELKDRG